MTKVTYAFLMPLPAFILALLLTGCGHGTKPQADAKPPPMPTLQVVAVTRGTLEKRLPASGTLQALPGQEAILSPPVTGILSTLNVRYGQSVTPGQIVAQLSTGQLTGQIQQAQATVGQNKVQVQQAQANALQQEAQTRTSILQAQAALRNAEAGVTGAKATLTGADAAVRNAQQSLTRQQTLLADGLVPQKDVEAAQLALGTAEAQRSAQQQAVAGQRQTVAGEQAAVAAARAAALQNTVKRQDVLVARQQLRNAEGALTTARAQVALYTLRSPLTGHVSAVGATPGETVDTTTKIATIVNLSRLQLNIGLPGDAVASVQRGQTVSFTVDSLPGRTFQAVIDTIAQNVDPATGTVPALAVVANPNRLLKDDTTARVQITTERHTNILIVPRGAVLSDPDTGKPSLVSVGADSVAHIIPVKIGLSVGDRVEIISGVSAGDQVAVSNQYGLPDGTKVQVQHGQ
jgi:HlyD family secretion protein